MAVREAGHGTALGDLVGALLPLSVRGLQRELAERLEKAPMRLNEFGFDPYGLSPAWWSRALLPMVLLYRYYFRVETCGIERVPAGRVLVVANHAGQLPFDGAMLSAGAAARGRSAADRASDGGVLDSESALGEHRGGARRRVGRDAEQLRPHARERRVRDGVPGRRARHEQALLPALPAPALRHGLHAPGARDGHADRAGRDRGSEEQQPGLANLGRLGKLLGMPAFPITATFPWLGPLGLLPLPVKYRIHFGEPLSFEGHSTDEDA